MTIQYNPKNTLIASDWSKIVHKTNKKEYQYLLKTPYKWLK
jgi:hypothetical protein